jgi:hypothetical protein
VIALICLPDTPPFSETPASVTLPGDAHDSSFNPHSAALAGNENANAPNNPALAATSVVRADASFGPRPRATSDAAV